MPIADGGRHKSAEEVKREWEAADRTAEAERQGGVMPAAREVEPEEAARRREPGGGRSGEKT